ncbi:MAG: DUF1203 domain-containing protein [Pseudomonadota bacterium]
MTFQIKALPAEPFAHLSGLSNQELAEQNAIREVVTDHPGAPCRVSLSEAKVGDTIFLVNHEHQPANSPYRSCHAIYVIEGAKQARLASGSVPESLSNRLISVRAFDAQDMIIEAEIVDGKELSNAIELFFKNTSVAYIHLHYAKRGCFAASVTRS